MAEMLFDELLSPAEEDGKSFTDRKDTANLEQSTERDLLQESGTVNTDLLNTTENMENITLDTALMEESIDLGNNSSSIADIASEDASPVETLILAENSEEAETVPDKSETFSQSIPGPNEAEKAIKPEVNIGIPAEKSEQDAKEDDSTDAKISKESNISKYFMSDDKTDDIFDTLASVNSEASKPDDIFDTLAPAEHPTSENKDVPCEDESTGQNKVRIHLESHSSVGEEATAVDFEEDKGELPLKPTPSTRSLTKYFTDNSPEEEQSADGKGFFDTFTATENLSGSPRLSSSSGFPSLEQPADLGSVAVPETPPIPSGSPIPSPFRQVPPVISPAPSAPASASQEPMPFFPTEVPEVRTPESSQPSTAGFSVDEDPFTIGLNLSDLDRRHDAWIPAETTRQVLVSLLAGPPGTVTLTTEQTTRPGIINNQPLGDPIRDLVQRYFGEQEAQKRVCLTADNVAQDETGLRQLIKAECWRSAVDLTGRLITQCGQGEDRINTVSKHTPYTLQLWYCRLSLLSRLHMYTAADAEWTAFGSLDKPDLFYEYYPDKYPGRRGSMVPFGMRVLHAELPQHLGKAQESLDRLHYLHAIVKKILQNLSAGLAEDGSVMIITDESRRASRELWESRDVQLMYCIVNCILSVKDYAAALQVLEDLMKKDPNNKAQLLCGVSRIYLQMGDITTAEKYFQQAEGVKTRGISPSQSHTNKGFLLLGQNHFVEAYENFEKAVTIDPSNAVALNNMAVCALYTGQLNKALELLEGLVHKDPALYLQEGILFNLCTLYELESSHAIYRKQQLLSLVSKHKGNGFNVASVKMV